VAINALSGTDAVSPVVNLSASAAEIPRQPEAGAESLKPAPVQPLSPAVLAVLVGEQLALYGSYAAV
jgi:hypothetical protein